MKKHHQPHVIEDMECDDYFKQKYGIKLVENQCCIHRNIVK